MARQKIQKHIEIMRSTIISLSSLSQESCDKLYATLKRHYAVVGVSIVNTVADLEVMVAKQPHLVFVGVKYVPGDSDSSADKVWISTYLDQAGIDYTGSGGLAHERELDKYLAKQCVHNAGVATSPFFMIKNGETHIDSTMKLQFPLFIKPVSLGGGVGIDEHSVVHTMAGFQTKVDALAQAYSSDILVEQYLSGREFSVAILQDEKSAVVRAMPIELVAVSNHNGDRLLSQAVKSGNQEVALAVSDPATRAKVIELATAAFAALGAHGYGRIDLRLDAAGIPHFLEANLIPSLIDGYGSFPKACAINAGMDYETMILHIVRLGMDRVTEDDLTEDESDTIAMYAAAAPAAA